MKKDVNDQDQTNLDDTNGGGGYSKPYKKIKNTPVTGYVIAGVIGLITILLLCTLL